MKQRTFTGTRTQKMQAYEIAHREVAREAAQEGLVLLKNENQLLPLDLSKPVALYGAGAGKTIKGGTGSGDVNERYSVSIYEGMKQAGFQITTGNWIGDFAERYAAAREAWKAAIWSDADREDMNCLMHMHGISLKCRQEDCRRLMKRRERTRLSMC